ASGPSGESPSSLQRFGSARMNSWNAKRSSGKETPYSASTTFRLFAKSSGGGVRTPDPAVNSRLLCHRATTEWNEPLWEGGLRSQAAEIEIEMYRRRQVPGG